MAYAAIEGDRRSLYMRSLDELEDRPVRGIEGGANPFFSPDGRWLGFEVDGKLKRIPMAGGAPVTICPTGPVHGAAWALDDTIVFASGFPSAGSDRPVGIPSYDVAPDGSGFVMLKVIRDEGAGARLVVVENWFEELKAKVPVTK